MRSPFLIAMLAAAVGASPMATTGELAAQGRRHPGEPAPPPRSLLGLLGEYDAPAGMRIALEDSGKLVFADTTGHRETLRAESDGSFVIAPQRAKRLFGEGADVMFFKRDKSGRATSAILGNIAIVRRAIEPLPGTNQLRVKPVRPVAELRKEALAASPPLEEGNFLPADLVELVKLDRTIKLEIRYATTNNFLGTRFYDRARAFMQRPAAEALVRANASLKVFGYGLLIHDAYRPWYVTKMFWDATPVEKRWLVANPAHGSNHNRGAAVDLTLYDLATGRPVEMPSTYDESTDRAHADYPGGTAAQRWRRGVLRRAMEVQGFRVNPNEWWHFDYRNWKQYAIGNVSFDKISK